MKDKIKNIAEKLEHQIRMHELDLNDRIKDIPQIILLLEQGFSELKEIVSFYKFKSEMDEIFFFKIIKPKFFSKLIYYRKVYNIEMMRPNGQDCVLKNYFINELNQLKSYIAQRQRMFIREQAADKLISKYEKNGVIPQFKNNQYDKDRRNDLVNTIRDIYCIQPKIFQGLNVEQGKTCVGFLNLLLDTDERENILNILEDIVRLSNEERLQLAQTLKRTSLNKILRTIKMIENRCAVVEMLRAIVYDLTKFATERNHIQQIIEDNYWLFGEQFNLVSADKPFEHALSEYLYILDGEKKSPQAIKSNERKRRPDIFICRKRGVDDTNDFSSILDENIIVELKRPSVIIGKEQFRQIEDYLDLIKREAKFNSQLRKWKFIVVSNKVDDYILEQYDSFKSYNKRFLVHIKEQFEIYAMTWDDIFQAFDIKHRFLLDKLDIDRVAIQDEYNLGNLLLDQASATRLTRQIKGLQVN